jgi:hypothetical protein
VSRTLPELEHVRGEENIRWRAEKILLSPPTTPAYKRGRLVNLRYHHHHHYELRIELVHTSPPRLTSSPPLSSSVMISPNPSLPSPWSPRPEPTLYGAYLAKLGMQVSS